MSDWVGTRLFSKYRLIVCVRLPLNHCCAKLGHCHAETCDSCCAQQIQRLYNYILSFDILKRNFRIKMYKYSVSGMWIREMYVAKCAYTQCKDIYCTWAHSKLKKIVFAYTLDFKPINLNSKHGKPNWSMHIYIYIYSGYFLER